MNNPFLLPPLVRLSQVHGEGARGGGSSSDPSTRRKFLKRTGGATVATMVAWNLAVAHATPEGQGSSNYDINSLYSAGNSTATVPSAGYAETGPYDIKINSPTTGSLKFKLKVKTNPTEGSIFYGAEAYEILSIAAIQAKIAQWVLKVVCNALTGYLTASDSINSEYQNPSLNSDSRVMGNNSHRVFFEITNKAISPTSGSSEIILTGTINARVQKESASGGVG